MARLIITFMGERMIGPWQSIEKTMHDAQVYVDNGWRVEIEPK